MDYLLLVAGTSGTQRTARQCRVECRNEASRSGPQGRSSGISELANTVPNRDRVEPGVAGSWGECEGCLAAVAIQERLKINEIRTWLVRLLNTMKRGFGFVYGPQARYGGSRWRSEVVVSATTFF